MTTLYTKQINIFGAQLLHGTNERWLSTYGKNKIYPLEHERRQVKIEMFDFFNLLFNFYLFDQFVLCF